MGLFSQHHLFCNDKVYDGIFSYEDIDHLKKSNHKVKYVHETFSLLIYDELKEETFGFSVGDP